VLFVELPLESVDVNVHPAKWEVRFADPPALHQLVRHGVAGAIGARRWLGAPGPLATAAPAPRPQASPAAGDWLFATPRPDRRSDALAAQATPTAPDPSARLRFAEQRLLGTLLATYLVLESKEGLLLVDQHAAHERVLFERLRAAWRERSVESQRLLLPVTVAVDPAQVARIAEATGVAAAFGFDVEPFAADAVVVRALPALLAGRDPAALVRELLELWPEAAALDPRAPDAGVADTLFASLACHAARRKGEALPDAEQRALLDALDAIPWAPTCPHGRPVAIPVELAEIERRFGRR
jgi:DNA mismatch repair protein MutL